MLEPKKNDQDKICFIDGDYKGYFREEGYKRVIIVGFDASTSDKGYIIFYVLDWDKKVVNRVNFRISPSDDFTSEVPLEKIIRLAMSDEMAEDCYVYEVDLDELIGFECQVRIERISNYYNITDVYPIGEELGEFVSSHHNRINPIIRDLFAKKGLETNDV